MIRFLKYSFSACLPPGSTRGDITLVQTDRFGKKYELWCSASGSRIKDQMLSETEAGQYSQKWKVELSPSKAQTILIMCENIPVTVSAVRPRISGRDGYFFTLDLLSGMNSVSFNWWCKLPEQWSSFENLVNVLNGLVKQHIPGTEYVYERD